jgi:hypothetical protein
MGRIYRMARIKALRNEGDLFFESWRHKKKMDDFCLSESGWAGFIGWPG